ncbi:transcriptional regulator, TetR family [Propionispira arboris]|uniref:Transcriptional regulator, TetR family n=1 Tax=Propionispira arboris TaxID=84035 RepID=A0A1H6UYW5_9FIRM|nr:TetR/AcrR family transcriptional regulator [Propionispira arboris]SEI97431.1 transcriptional regulator, TetR family [Propionispira arboris]
MENVSTREKILAAATALIADKGFKETTTRDIATASSVSEMSVFRHFGSKKAILLAIIQHYSFEYPIENGLKEQLTWELDHDILLLAKMQYEFNLKNEKAILIRFKESRKLVEYGIDVKENPTRLKNFLIEYFDEMYRRGKIIKEDNEKLAIHFMSFNFGLFCNKMMDVYGPITLVSKEEEIYFGAQCFARGIALLS